MKRLQRKWNTDKPNEVILKRTFSVKTAGFSTEYKSKKREVLATFFEGIEIWRIPTLKCFKRRVY